MLNPERAEDVEDVGRKVVKWKADIAKLTYMDKDAVTDEDRVQPYWTILPETIQDHLLNRGFNPDEWETFEKLEQAVEGFIRR